MAAYAAMLIDNELSESFLVIAQSEINMAIGDDPPAKYFPDVAAQCNGGEKKYGGITDAEHLRIAAISAAASSWSIVTDAGGVEAHRQHDPPAKPAADQRGQPGQKPADGNPRSAQNPDAGPYRDAAISRSSARAPARIPSMP